MGNKKEPAGFRPLGGGGLAPGRDGGSARLLEREKPDEKDGDAHTEGALAAPEKEGWDGGGVAGGRLMDGSPERSVVDAWRRTPLSPFEISPPMPAPGPLPLPRPPTLAPNAPNPPVPAPNAPNVAGVSKPEAAESAPNLGVAMSSCAMLTMRALLELNFSRKLPPMPGFLCGKLVCSRLIVALRPTFDTCMCDSKSKRCSCCSCFSCFNCSCCSGSLVLCKGTLGAGEEERIGYWEGWGEEDGTGHGTEEPPGCNGAFDGAPALACVACSFASFAADSGCASLAGFVLLVLIEVLGAFKALWWAAGVMLEGEKCAGIVWWVGRIGWVGCMGAIGTIGPKGARGPIGGIAGIGTAMHFEDGNLAVRSSACSPVSGCGLNWLLFDRLLLIGVALIDILALASFALLICPLSFPEITGPFSVAKLVGPLSVAKLVGPLSVAEIAGPLSLVELDSFCS